MANVFETLVLDALSFQIVKYIVPEHKAVVPWPTYSNAILEAIATSSQLDVIYHAEFRKAFDRATYSILLR